MSYRLKPDAPSTRKFTAEQLAAFAAGPRPPSSTTAYSRWWKARNPEAVEKYKARWSHLAKEVTRKCVVCGSSFTSHGCKRQYCRQGCRVKFLADKKEKLRLSRIPKPCVCKGCGVVFSPIYKNIKLKYCSRACGNRTLTRKHYYLRQLRKQYQRHVPLARAILSYLKHNGLQAKCYYCEKSGDAHFFEVDHVNPIAQDGDNGEYNFVIACKSCNSRKRDRKPVASSVIKHGELSFSCSSPPELIQGLESGRVTLSANSQAVTAMTS